MVAGSLKLPAQAELLRMFDYCVATGLLTWRIRPSACVSVGDRAGDRHGRVMSGGRSYKISRVIWKMVNDEEPPEVDHRDLDNSNNVLSNLRAATSSQNSMNRRTRSDNTTGAKGVYRRNGEWGAKIIVAGRHHFLGQYKTLEEARDAYNAGSVKYHGEFGRSNH